MLQNHRRVTGSRLLLLYLISLSILGYYKTIAFSNPSVFVRTETARRQLRDQLTSFKMIDALFSEPVKTKVIAETNILLDKNGKKFEVGSLVRVCVAGLKQFQIPPKGFGAFDANKKFTPDKSTEKGIKKCFVLPVGLRGTVTKVYSVEHVSANFPIQVKFEPGKGMEEGYNAPSTFVMHFMEYEVECV